VRLRWPRRPNLLDTELPVAVEDPGSRAGVQVLADETEFGFWSTRDETRNGAGRALAGERSC
jgi:hypothetical protein